MVISADGLFALPPDADPQQLAMLAINPPTAALLLSEYVDLKSGDWVVQNAANSGVGRWVIALAKTRGLRTVNIVRRPEFVDELEAIGGDVVVVDSPDVAGRIKAAVGQDDLHLALDGVSGPATGVLASTLSPRGTLVSFAAMSEAPMSISPLDVIFKPSSCGASGWATRNLPPKFRQPSSKRRRWSPRAWCTYQWPPSTPSPRSRKPWRTRNGAGRSFWTLPDHPPDLE